MAFSSSRLSHSKGMNVKAIFTRRNAATRTPGSTQPLVVRLIEHPHPQGPPQHLGFAIPAYLEDNCISLGWSMIHPEVQEWLEYLPKLNQTILHPLLGHFEMSVCASSLSRNEKRMCEHELLVEPERIRKCGKKSTTSIWIPSNILNDAHGCLWL
jgi:hypothetical protein